MPNHESALDRVLLRCRGNVRLLGLRVACENVQLRANSELFLATIRNLRGKISLHFLSIRDEGEEDWIEIILQG